MSTPRRPSRSASIPIPGASGRSLNDLLNFNNLSPPTSTGASSTSPRQERPQQRSNTSSRHPYSALEGMLPPTTVGTASPAPGRAVGTVGTSSSLGSSSGPVRHPLGGGSGGPWAASRSASTSSALMTGAGPHHHQHRRTTSAQIPRLITGFEPRIIQGTPTGPRERHGTAASTPEVGQPGSPRSPVRRRESHDGASTSPTRSLRLSGSGTLPRHVRTLPPQHEVTEPGAKVVIPNNSSHQHTNLPSTGGPVPFSRPSYLQYSALRDFIHTDENALTQTGAEPNPLHFEVHASSSTARDATPTTESDDDSESSTGYVSRVRRPSAGPRGREGDRGRLRERQNTFVNTTNDTLVLQVPTKWNDQDRNQFLKISEDGRNVHFHGPSSQGEKEAAAVRADHSVPPACGIYYYEVTIMDKGNKGHISVGFSTKTVRLTRLPGWEKESWGYHGDDGHSFASERDGTPFGPRFTTGDVIGCGIDFSLYKAFYTKNGAFLGFAFDNVGRENEVFPSIGLRTSGESVRANFGQDTFRYDIDYHVHRAREIAWKNIQSTPVKWSIDDARDIFVIEADKELSMSGPSTSANAAGPSGANNKDSLVKNEADTKVKQESTEEVFVPIQLPPDYREPLDKLVMSYLHHHGYEKTARALQAQRDARKRNQACEGISRPKTEDVDVDIKMETEDDFTGTSTRGDTESPFDPRGSGGEGSASRPDPLWSRQKIVSAVARGEIDAVLQMAQEECPVVLEANQGLMLFKLRCRKFVELMLETSEALKKTRAETPTVDEEDAAFEFVDVSENGNAMEVDEDGEFAMPVVSTNGFANGDAKKGTSIPGGSSGGRGAKRSRVTSPAMMNYQRALGDALSYGRKLQSDYLADTRLEVQTLLKRTFSLVTYDDPTTAAAADVVELVSQEARAQLAQEMNRAILESQGRPSRPALERIFRQASAIVRQLALGGVGEAAFADVRKEFGETTI